jgi:hypothetical protein
MYEHERVERRQQKVLPPARAVMPPEAIEYRSVMTEYLTKRGLSAALARLNGWYPSDRAGDGEPRIVIPAVNRAGRVFWQARAMGDALKRYQSPAAPRLDSLILVWPHGTPSAVVAVEGPMDALAAAEWDALGVALMGMAPPAEALSHLAVLLPDLPVIVLADADALPAAVRTFARLAEWGRIGRLVSPPAPYKDLAEVPREECATVLGL